MTDVLLVNWLTPEVVQGSLRVLAKEKDVNVILVNVEDNTPEGTVFLPENKGVSAARNKGLELSTAPYVFLLDGDIQYIKGTIPWMLENIPEDAGCLGVHNTSRWDGTRDRSEADVSFKPGNTQSGFPMAWTQYGLFNGDFLRTTRFVEEGVFSEAGNGYEDDWCYQDMLAADFKSYYVDDVLYYHEAHAGNRNLKAKGVDNKNKERLELFQKRWGFDPTLKA
jgi:glycosyltransferase involved in cell wall biosynthesis